MADNNPYMENGSADMPEASSSPSAYCQECGRALTSGTLRRLGGGVFCIPCAAQRSSAGGWDPVSAGPGFGTNAAGLPPQTPSSGSANPARACLLGFIPGVGAMYNGQYAKAAMHLVVFVGLLTLADHLNDVFYWLVWGWVFYQVFDAYHTARARRDGLPLPDPFGWNEVGERWGFSSHAGAAAAAPAARAAADRQAVQGRVTTGPAPAPWAEPVPVDAAKAAEPVAPTPRPYAPVTEFPRPYTAPFVNPEFRTARDAPVGSPTQPRAGAWQASPATPYSATYMGDPSDMGSEIAGNGRRFPMGAVWLIGLGFVFLLGNVLPHFAIQGHWLVPLLLIGVAIWSGVRRVEQQRVSAAIKGKVPNIACALVGPAVLLTLAVLMALQSAGAAPLAHTWPLLLVIWGGMLLAQRALDRPGSAFPEAAPGYPVDPLYSDNSDSVPAAPVRSTSGTGSLGL